MISINASYFWLLFAITSQKDEIEMIIVGGLKTFSLIIMYHTRNVCLFKFNELFLRTV